MELLNKVREIFASHDVELEVSEPKKAQNQPQKLGKEEYDFVVKNMEKASALADKLLSHVQDAVEEARMSGTEEADAFVSDMEMMSIEDALFFLQDWKARSIDKDAFKKKEKFSKSFIYEALDQAYEATKKAGKMFQDAWAEAEAGYDQGRKFLKDGSYEEYFPEGTKQAQSAVDFYKDWERYWKSTYDTFQELEEITEKIQASTDDYYALSRQIKMSRLNNERIFDLAAGYMDIDPMEADQLFGKTGSYDPEKFAELLAEYMSGKEKSDFMKEAKKLFSKKEKFSNNWLKKELTDLEERLEDAVGSIFYTYETIGDLVISMEKEPDQFTGAELADLKLLDEIGGDLDDLLNKEGNTLVNKMSDISYKARKLQA